MVALGIPCSDLFIKFNTAVNAVLGVFTTSYQFLHTVRVVYSTLPVVEKKKNSKLAGEGLLSCVLYGMYPPHPRILKY